MTDKHDATTEGVSLAFDRWLAQHDITVPDVVENAVGRSFAAWLAGHSDELITAIAEAVAKRSEGTVR